MENPNQLFLFCQDLFRGCAGLGRGPKSSLIQLFFQDAKGKVGVTFS